MLQFWITSFLICRLAGPIHHILHKPLASRLRLGESIQDLKQTIFILFVAWIFAFDVDIVQQHHGQVAT